MEEEQLRVLVAEEGQKDRKCRGIIQPLPMMALTCAFVQH